MDLVIVRENTEGFYADRNMHQGIGEFMPTPDMALAVRKITAKASQRIARTAFRLAMKRRRKVTAGAQGERDARLRRPLPAGRCARSRGIRGRHL
jgi:isocitrate/isopropylmalate dehydrogenase